MPKQNTKQEDKDVRSILDALRPFAEAHPQARIDIHRDNDVIIRIRIIDPGFQGLDRVERDAQIWPLLEKLPEDTLNQITFMLPITPKETKKSMANMDFEDSLAGKNSW
jgi:hypothetical protein